MLDIHIKIHKKAKCPHCGGEIKGDVVNEIDTSGRQYFTLLDEIGYYGYGNYMRLDNKQIKTVIDAFMEQFDQDAAIYLSFAIIEEMIVEFEADW